MIESGEENDGACQILDEISQINNATLPIEKDNHPNDLEESNLLLNQNKSQLTSCKYANQSKDSLFFPQNSGK